MTASSLLERLANPVGGRIQRAFQTEKSSKLVALLAGSKQIACVLWTLNQGASRKDPREALGTSK